VNEPERFDARGLFAALARHDVAHRTDLIEMKRAAGRPQDLADIRLLESLDDST
jgi:hypothetical protein